MPASKFTPANRKALITAVRNGNFILPSCRALRINEKTYYRWLEKGRDARALEEEGGHKLSPAETAYAKFLTDIEQADAQSENALVDEVLELARDGNQGWRGVWQVLSVRHAHHWKQDNPAISLDFGEQGGKGLEIKLAFTPPPVVERDDVAA